MSVFNVPVTIGVDEDKIAREIESEVKEKVIRNIGDKVEEIIYKKDNYYGYRRRNEPDDSPLRNMIISAVKDVLTEKEDLIVTLAAKQLADKLSRQKAVKAIGVEVAEKVLSEE